jgi:hypothetical protein
MWRVNSRSARYQLNVRFGYMHASLRRVVLGLISSKCRFRASAAQRVSVGADPRGGECANPLIILGLGSASLHLERHVAR